MNRLPAPGTDLIAALNDPTSFADYSSVRYLPAPNLYLEKDFPIPASEIGPFTVKRTDRVKVRGYNPGCVTSAEYRRLRIGMSKGDWHRIIGGGTFQSRASGGIEIRSYNGCWWSGPDEVWIGFVGGRVQNYQQY